MAEVDIEIGGRIFKVACQEGEEDHLHSAAKLLDDEATHLMNATGKLPEPKMLLMAGLMLADKVAGLSPTASPGGADADELRTDLAQAKAKIAELEESLAAQAAASTAAMSSLVDQTERLAQELDA